MHTDLPLVDRNFQVQPNAGQGCCTLFSIDQGLRGTATSSKAHALTLRRKIANAMLKDRNKSLFDGAYILSDLVMSHTADLCARGFNGRSFDQYIKWIQVPGRYLGSFELRTCAQLESRYIVVVRKDKRGKWSEMQAYGDPTHPLILLKHTGSQREREHYELMRPTAVRADDDDSDDADFVSGREAKQNAALGKRSIKEEEHDEDSDGQPDWFRVKREGMLAEKLRELADKERREVVLGCLPDGWRGKGDTQSDPMDLRDSDDDDQGKDNVAPLSTKWCPAIGQDEDAELENRSFEVLSGLEAGHRIEAYCTVG